MPGGISMTTTQPMGLYECHNAYRDLHSGPTGREWAAFVAECNGRLEGDGAAVCSPQAVTAMDSTPRPQPAPSPSTGGAR